MATINEKMTAVADAIREYAHLDNRLTLDDMAQAPALIHEQAYQQGEMDGRSAGEEAGFAAGKEQGEKDYWNAFWDMFQQNGSRVTYTYAFAEAFTDELFKPKYDLRPTNANQMFMGSLITNLKQLLEDAGVELDTSNAKYITQAFTSSKTTHLPVIDCTSSTLISATFMAESLVYIEKVIVKETHTFPNAFGYASKLTEVRFEGAIANDINFQWSPLSVESMKSIISCLSTSVSGKTITFNDACWAALEASGVSPTGGTWKNYVTDLGWNA